MELYGSVTQLKGVGKTKAELLATLGIVSIFDLISYFPRDYEDRTKLVTIQELKAGEPACFQAMVIAAPRTAYIRKGLELTRLTVADMTGKLKITFFNQKYTAERLEYGQEYLFYGTINGDFSGYQMQNPTVEPCSGSGIMTRRILPVYPLTSGLSNRTLVQLIQAALDACGDQLPELLPEEMRRQYQLCDAAEAYRSIHAPASFEALSRAQRRLCFEEFFIFSAGLMLLRSRRTGETGLAFADRSIEPFEQALPFALTGAQKRAIGEILDDLAGGAPMNRLVQGDVGSGKTMIAAAAIYCAAKNGYQSALMAPTEILAEQHAATLSPLLRQFGIETVLLTGSQGAAAKRSAREALADGRAMLAIGTQALISDQTQFHSLGLVVADEQHRFGVAQRGALQAKGASPHLLVMSATPIPRTLALMLYGDLDLSIVDERPPGRQEIDTFLVDERYRTRLNSFIRKQVDAGHQVFVVCPAVEESELDSLKSAEAWAQMLQSSFFPDLRVELLHGQMKGTEKERIMLDFAAHKADILVTTTVIEVGVDVPNATLMIVENAERFGLSQLHQLRGRVGRGDAKSYCVLVSDAKNEQTLARLKALCKTNDGFKIAETDLALRGPGDFFGARQHGLPAFRIADLSSNLETLQQAQEACANFLQADRVAADPAYQPLMRRISALFSDSDAVFN
jgi:ATP-dependent DNA helicase RecG